MLLLKQKNFMKVAYLFGSLNRGGTETLMLDVCQNLQITHFDAIGICRKGGVLEDDFLHSGVPFTKLTPGKNILKYLWNLRKMISKNQVEVIHAQQPLDALYARIACIGMKVKLVLTFHGFDFNSSSAFTRYIIRRTNRNIFVSHYQKEYYIRKYRLNPEKQTVVYNGINFSKFDNLHNQNINHNLRKDLKIQDSTLLMGMVGNFNEVRDQLTVCRFLKLLNERGVDFHFVFVGKRVESTALRYDDCVEFCQKNSLSERVTFAGVRSDVPAVLSELDAFIYSTEHDTFGIAVVEAIAAGTPVFVNDWEVMNEITEEGKLAMIYKTKDENDLLEKFMLFLQHQDEYEIRAKENAVIVREKYSIEKHIENLKKVYLSLH